MNPHKHLIWFPFFANYEKSFISIEFLSVFYFNFISIKLKFYKEINIKKYANLHE